MAGSAVATMVWSTTARNIGSMMEGYTREEQAAGGGLCLDVVFHGVGSGPAALWTVDKRPDGAPPETAPCSIKLHPAQTRRMHTFVQSWRLGAAAKAPLLGASAAG